MKKKLIWIIILLILLGALYEVIFRTKTVTYMGEDRDWLVKVHAKLVGLNGSYNIEVQYKGKESIQFEVVLQANHFSHKFSTLLPIS